METSLGILKSESLVLRKFLLVFLCLVSLLDLSSCLVLTRGQRIAPRTTEPTSDQPSLFNLPLVEKWATRQSLSEQHLKTLYRLLMNGGTTDDTLYQSLCSSSFPKRQAKHLVKTFAQQTSKLIETRQSKSGGQKLVIQLSSGKMIETVLIQHNTQKGMRYTVCVSSQVGCARACSFCATGTMGLQAQLSSAEILEQVWIAKGCIDDPEQLRNVVFMGMVGT